MPASSYTCVKITVLLVAALVLYAATFGVPSHLYYSGPATVPDDLTQQLYVRVTTSDKLTDRQRQKEFDADTNGGAILVRAIRSPETNPFLIELNKPYHAQRRSVRAASNSGNPLGVHVFFTMDCTDHSMWQAGALEYSWERVGQEGFLTRIISGCETAKRAKVERSKRHFLSSDEVAERRRGSFYAPYSSRLPSGRVYAPYNRPSSVHYWLKHADLIEDVFVMLDPDMVFLNTLPTASVRLGRPMSQVYDYMQHTPFEAMECPSCPKERYDRQPYAVGPPWMMHLSDWVRVTPRWLAVCSELAELQPKNWIVEMIAYSIACKVENLPHTPTYRAMVDYIDDDVVWDPVSDSLGLRGGASGNPSATSPGDGRALPSTLHYCYTFEVGEPTPAENAKFAQHTRWVTRDAAGPGPLLEAFHWSKYRVPTDWPGGETWYERNFMACECPLLQEFHSLGRVLDAAFVKQAKRPALVPASYTSKWRRAATMLDLLLPTINAAMAAYKTRYCPAATRNLSKLLRTTHPTHFVSRWELDSWDAAGTSVKFHRFDANAPV